MIGVIADDLTGAAEIGAVGLRHGLSAEIVVAGKPNGKSALICVDTDSRSLSPREASKRVAMATRQLRDAGAEWIYKKTDSVLRGRVTAEIESILKELKYQRALFLPANPSLGRTIRGGKYFFHGKPIHRTDFVRDPEYPRTSADVLKLLATSRKFPVRVVSQNDAFAEKGIFIGEVSSITDTQRWMKRVEPRMLLAGGAETFAAALQARGLAARVPRSVESVTQSGGELFVCGSASVACRNFVETARARGVAVFTLPLDSTLPFAARRIAMTFKSRRRVVLNLQSEHVTTRVAALLTKQLVELAAQVMEKSRVGNIFVEGGATAAALVHGMGWKHLLVERELALGVVRLATHGRNSQRLTIKPGSYTWPAEIVR